MMWLSMNHHEAICGQPGALRRQPGPPVDDLICRNDVAHGRGLLDASSQHYLRECLASAHGTPCQPLSPQLAASTVTWVAVLVGTTVARPSGKTNFTPTTLATGVGQVVREAFDATVSDPVVRIFMRYFDTEDLYPNCDVLFHSKRKANSSMIC